MHTFTHAIDVTSFIKKSHTETGKMTLITYQSLKRFHCEQILKKIVGVLAQN